MRKPALAGSVTFPALALLLLLLLGTMARHPKPRPAVIRFEPVHAPRQPVKSRVFLPPTVA